MNVEALREDAAWTQGKQPRMAVRPSWVLALCELAAAAKAYSEEWPTKVSDGHSRLEAAIRRVEEA